MSKVQTTVTVSVRLQLPQKYSQKTIIRFIEEAIRRPDLHNEDTRPILIETRITNKETSYA